MKNWKDMAERMEKLLRLRTYPVALKLFESPEEMDKIEGLQRLDRKASGCQLVTIARTYGMTIGATAEDLMLPLCAGVLGLVELPEYLKDGSLREIIWVKERENAKKCDDSIPKIPAGKYKAVAYAPLMHERFEPNMILVAGTPAQMILLVNGIQFERYERLQFFCVGETACADSIAQCYISGKPSLSLPCFGERWLGGVQEEELLMAIPSKDMENAIKGMEGLAERGIRYPIPYLGPLADPRGWLPPAYLSLAGLEKEAKESRWGKP
jgi:uncharacterized protein (DUF169 family)